MKKEFVLPNMWYIKITDKNRNIINDWKLQTNYSEDLLRRLDYTIVQSNGAGGTRPDSNYLNLITTKQFIEHVLKNPGKEQPLKYLTPLLKKLNIT